MRLSLAAAASIALLFLDGCASTPPPPPPVRETVVLLPETADQAAAVVVSVSGVAAPGGGPPAEPRPASPGAPGGKRAAGVVTVATSGGTATLDEPYETAEVTSAGGISTRTMDESEASRRFGASLAARPPRPVSFTLYFIEGTDQLTPESIPTLSQVKTLMGGWPAPEVSVIGHTDRVGGEEANDRLGRQRAEMVERALVEIGVDAGKIEVVSRGEREPLVPTDDEVPEPRNRRVEITVR